MNEHADSALLIAAYYKLTALIDEAGTTFIEAAPDDPDRQFRLQSKLMTAVLANFIRTMPMITDEEVFACVNIAMMAAAQRDPDEPTPTNLN
jgi:hypothetical protein